MFASLLELDFEHFDLWAGQKLETSIARKTSGRVQTQHSERQQKKGEAIERKRDLSSFATATFCRHHKRLEMAQIPQELYHKYRPSASYKVTLFWGTRAIRTPLSSAPISIKATLCRAATANFVRQIPVSILCKATYRTVVV